MKLTSRILDLAIQIQQIPAPTFFEEKRAEFIRARFEEEVLSSVEMDSYGNVLGYLPGTGNAPPLVITAHSDTVFPFDTDLKLTHQTDTLHGPGIGDNSLGVAGLFGIIWYLRQQSVTLPGDLWLAANVREEGLGNLDGMRAIVDRFNKEPLAYLVLEGMALGQIYHQGLGVQRYRITANSAGGHSWVDFGTPSAIHELATLATRLTSIEIPKKPRTSLNIGVISGGISINTIASHAFLELDLRSTASNALRSLVQKVVSLVLESNKPGIKFQADIIGQRPTGKISKNHPLVKIAAGCLKDEGITPNLNIGSTDANIPLSLGLPSICIGLTHGGGAHTVNEYIQTKPLQQGMNQLVNLVIKIFDTLK